MFVLYELATHLQQSHCKLCTSSCAYLQRYMYLISYRCLASKRLKKKKPNIYEQSQPLQKNPKKRKQNKSKKGTNLWKL